MALEPLLALVLPVVLALLAIKLWHMYVDNSRDKTNPLPLPPGDYGFPLVGESLELIYKGFQFFRERRNAFGCVYKTHIYGRPTVRVFGSANLRTVLKAEEVLVTMHWPRSVRKLMGYGAVAQSTRRLHSLRRTSLLKAFSSQAIAAYLPSIQATIRDHLSKWSEKSHILAHQECRLLSLDAILRVLFGVSFPQGELKSLTEAMIIIQENLFSLPYEFLPGSGLRKGMKARQHIVKTLDEAIRRAIRERDSTANSSNSGSTVNTAAHSTYTIRSLGRGGSGVVGGRVYRTVHNASDKREEGDCALDVILRSVEDQELTLAEIRDNCIEMIFSAVGGISSAVCSMIIQLNDNPECVDRIRAELSSTGLSDGSGTSSDLSAANLRRLPYSQQVLKEVIRCIPPFGGGYREVMKTFELEGYQIPKGWTILWSIRDQHELASIFEEPERFDPDRWSEERDCSKYDQYSYVAFGSGLRKCIGERYVMAVLNVLLIELVRGYHWNLPEPRSAMTYFPIALPVNELPLEVSRQQL